MDIFSIDKLVLFVGFVIPGFVSLKAYELLYPSTPKESDKRIVDAITYSCLNYAILFWPIFEIENANIGSDFPRLYLVFYFFVLFIAPISWVCILKKLRETSFFQKSLPHPTGAPWDYVFAKRKPYWMIVTLKDKTQIAGKYERNSFASSAPAPAQLYLEEAWVVNADGGFARPRVDSAGVLVLSSEIASVELFNMTMETKDERHDSAEGRVPAAREGVQAGAIEAGAEAKA